MAQIFQIFAALKEILIRALPTFLLFVALFWYLKKVLFQPLERTLADRRARTAGAVEAAEAAVAAAGAKMAAYEKALQDARAAVYAEQEDNRRRLAATQFAAIDAARRRTAEQVRDARATLAAESAAAQAALAADSDRLAEQITAAVLAGRN